MNLFRVVVSLNGKTCTMWLKCRDEVEAFERANATLIFGGRVEDVRWIRRES